MILLGLLTTLFLTTMLIMLLCKVSKTISAWIAAFGMMFGILLTLMLYQDIMAPVPNISYYAPWIKALNVNFHLMLSPLSFWLVLLSLFMGLLAIIVSQPQKPASYYAAICLAVMALVGIFLAADMFLFFIFWELALLPIYFLLARHGNYDDSAPVLRYIIYTQVSGLILLLSIIGLVIAHYDMTGIMTFDYHTLKSVPLPPTTQKVLFFGFALAFAIKLPIFPFHTWLLSLLARAEVPVILIGVLIKSSVFGLMLFSWPLFPDACSAFAVPLMAAGLFSLIYGAIMALAQNDPRNVVAFLIISHVGFMFTGIHASAHQAFLGLSILMMAQACSTGGLLIILDKLKRSSLGITIADYQGLWSRAPKASFFLFVFFLASIGTPLFGNFIGEWLVILAIFKQSVFMAVGASLGIVLSAAYCLWLFQRLCFSKSPDQAVLQQNDVATSDMLLASLCLIILLFLGLYPPVITNTIAPAKNPPLSQTQEHLEKKAGNV